MAEVTLVDQWIAKAKNHPVIATVFVVLIALGGLASFTESIGKLRTLFEDKAPTPPIIVQFPQPQAPPQASVSPPRIIKPSNNLSPTAKHQVRSNAPLETTARSFFALIDAKEYEKAWKNAAHFSKEAIEKNSWIQGIDDLAIGTPTSRKISQVVRGPRQPDTGLPGAAVAFNASYASGTLRCEIVELIDEPDGIWRWTAYAYLEGKCPFFPKVKL